VLVDAVTGECTEYSMDRLRSDPALQWIDRVFSASLLVTQYNFHGKYAGGFWNSLLGQKGVKTATDGYTYLAKEDDVFMYTGVTSATTDKSIIGFLLVNQRTKKADFYKMEGAMESSAEEAAEGLVSAYKWEATFPLLINISGQPTYFLSLKDDSKVVQGYAMVNVAQYNKIKVWGKTLTECTNLYVQALRDNGITAVKPDVVIDPEGEQTVTGAISDIRTAVVNGNTTYYIRLNNAGPYYTITVAQTPEVVLYGDGTVVSVTCFPTDSRMIVPASGITDAVVETPVEEPAEPVEEPAD